MYKELEEVTIDGKTYRIGDHVGYAELGWHSDWNGDEVGYDDVPVVGLYTFLGSTVDLYLDTETGTILEMWVVDDEEEGELH